MKWQPLVDQGLSLSELPEGVARYRTCVYLSDRMTLDEARAFLYNGRITCLSAAKLYGLPIVDQASVRRTHVALPRNRGLHYSLSRMMDDVVIHREAARITENPANPWVVDFRQAVIRCLACADIEQAVAIVDAVRFQRLCPVEDLRVPDDVPGARRVHEALRRSRGGVRSVLETMARLQLEDAGIESRTAVEIPGVGEVDLLIHDRLVVELDGWEFHSGKAHWLHDLERDRRLVERGFLVLRFDYDAVVSRSEVVPAVRAALSQVVARRRPPSSPGTHTRD